MEEGVILNWLRDPGELIAAGEPIVEIETDKATMEYEAEAGGILEILVAVGSTVPLGTAIARLLPEGSTFAESPAAPAPAVASTDVPYERSAASASSDERGAAAAGSRNGSSTVPRVLATPVARRIAAELGIDLQSVAATGRRGQIVKSDVLSHAPPSLQDSVVPVVSRATAGTRRVEISRLQKTVARRMAQSRATVPDFEVSVDIDMTAAVALRGELKEFLDPAPSVNDMVVRACALALQAHPRVNAAWRDEGFDLFSTISVGVAVALDDALLVAVVPDTERMSLREIAKTTRQLAQRARSGAITPAELAGATFTVSNLGMFGVDRFSAIINQPQAAILAIGAISERPVARDGAVVVRSMMTATLAADHRILYGADGARFITDVRDRLQAPLGLLA
jgi:pyruvate dehydrogenase E2 component (dihydrolipoamide acetyltransferase)